MGRDRLRRVTRLLRILSLLQSGKAMGLAALAGACECCAKTIQRDLSYWHEMDVNIVYDVERKGYVLDGDPPFKMLDLGVVEATAVALAEASVQTAAGLNLERSIATAFEKIHDLVPPEVAARLDGCREALLGDGHAKRDYSRAPLLPLIDACRRGVTVDVDYDSRSSRRRYRPIEPYRIAFIDGFWMVIARDPERGEVRNFALDRIHACRPPALEKRFRVPADWSFTDYMAGSVGVLRGEKTEIVLRFEAEAAAWVRGRQWRFVCSLSAPAADGSVTLSATVAGLDEITREVLRWGRHVTVVEPPALRCRVAEEARAIAAKYAG